MSDKTTHFITDYKPDMSACVELTNGKFFDVINGNYFESGTRVFITNGKIQSVTETERVNSNDHRKADFSINLQGRTVLPGLFNTHCHINMTTPSWFATIKDVVVWKFYHEKQKIKNMAECIAHGVTHIRDSYSEDLSATHKLKSRIESGTIPGPRIHQAVVVGPSGSYFAEKDSLKRRISRSVVCVPTIDHSKTHAGVIEFPVNATAQIVRDTVDRAIDERGADAIKIGEQLISTTSYKPDAMIMTMDQLSALADQAHRRGVKTIIHQITTDTFRRAVAAGVNSLAHIASDAILADDDIDAFIAAGCIIEPTLTVQYDLAWKIRGNRFCEHPDMNQLSDFRDSVYTFSHIGNEFYIKALQKSLNVAYDRFKHSRFKVLGGMDLTRLYGFYAGMVDHGNTNFRKLFNKGALISVSNDSGIPPCTPGMAMLELMLTELILNRSSETRKMTGADAARMATINGAKALGVEDEFGSIEPGKTADLVILDGDLLKDCQIIGSRAAALFKDGKLVINNCNLKVNKH